MASEKVAFVDFEAVQSEVNVDNNADLVSCWEHSAMQDVTMYLLFFSPALSVFAFCFVLK